MGRGSPCGRPGRPASKWRRRFVLGLRLFMTIFPAGFRREVCCWTPSEGGAGLRRRRSRRLRAECRCRIVEAAPLAAARAPRAVLYKFSPCVASGWTGVPAPERRNPSAATPDPQRSFRHGHRSPARPHDASRSPLGSGGTGRSIQQVLEAGIDWGIVPA
jgi:hypothetical protein